MNEKLSGYISQSKYEYGIVTNNAQISVFQTSKGLCLTHAVYITWARGGILFLIAIQGSRLTEKPSFCDVTFSNTGFWVSCGEGRENKNRALPLKFFHPEVTHITSTHSLLSKGTWLVCLPEREENGKS